MNALYTFHSQQLQKKIHKINVALYLLPLQQSKSNAVYEYMHIMILGDYLDVILQTR
jgi:hypothetical protein